jgi:hypothetical protein
MRSESGTHMRDSTTHPRWSSPFAALVVLAVALIVSSPATAQWNVRNEPASGGATPSCVMVTERQELPDGYQKTWAQILVDNETVRVTSASQLDPGDGDIGLVVDDGSFVRVDEVVASRTAVFKSRYDELVEGFKRGLKVRVQLRFWPTWPKTSTHSATFSLIGFTRTHARLAECRTP